jgi:nitrate reductase delta subunit
MAGPRTLHAFCQLLSYPGEHVLEASELLFIILQSQLPEAAEEVARFGAFVEQHDQRELEEAYTAAFEINPACALEIGWQLFGEDYDRGLLLVRLRQELRAHGLPESTELPDHLTHVLPLIGAMSEDEAQRFVEACVIPAVVKMRDAFAESENPYGAVLRALTLVLQSVWGEGCPLPDGSGRYRAEAASHPPGVDLLHAFPVADVQFGCGSGCGGGCGEHDAGDHHNHDAHRTALPLVQLGSLLAEREETR